ncbi:MAG: endonuclease domain-containing protein [Clostridia bacterium]|nr:endonuclease domain-containing protein [Clostridia bacterium]
MRLLCVKGGGTHSVTEGLNLQRKHNKDIVPTAKILRRNMTKEEKHLWYDFLRVLPVRFSRQKVLGKYITDFYCAKANLIIELDGSGHYTKHGIQYDEERTAFLEEYGLTVIRISNTEIHKNFWGVCEYIENFIKQSLSQLH